MPITHASTRDTDAGPGCGHRKAVAATDVRATASCVAFYHVAPVSFAALYLQPSPPMPKKQGILDQAILCVHTKCRKGK
jgi:hypothetical protein